MNAPFHVYNDGGFVAAPFTFDEACEAAREVSKAYPGEIHYVTKRHPRDDKKRAYGVILAEYRNGRNTR